MGVGAEPGSAPGAERAFRLPDERHLRPSGPATLVTTGLSPQSGLLKAGPSQIDRKAQRLDPADHYFLRGGGEAARRIAGFDWSTTSLGAITSWGPGLRTAVGMMLASHFPKAIVWGPDRITVHNDAFRPILGGKPDAQGQPFHVIWEEVWDEIAPIMARAFAGEAVFIEDFPLVINRFGYAEQSYFTFCYSPIRDEHGEIAGVIDTVVETTARVETQRRTEALNAELAHRMRNTLAIVASIASQTLRTQSTTVAAAEALSARLRALAGTHSLLTKGAAVEAHVDALIREALSPHLGGLNRVALSGPSVLLPERQALSLSLAVNELATNALKHGALSTPAGLVDIAWATGGDADFVFTWTERSGPSIAPPQRGSFGTTLLREIVPGDFRGASELTFAAAGFEYRLCGRIERPHGIGEHP